MLQVRSLCIFFLIMNTSLFLLLYSLEGCITASYSRGWRGGEGNTYNTLLFLCLS